MPSQTEIRQQVTQQIIAALEQNLLPWRRPWRATTASASQPGRHSNVASRKPYQGVNPILLDLHAMQHGLLSRWWGTFPMWKSLGCDIKKRPPNVEQGCWGFHSIQFCPLVDTIQYLSVMTDRGDGVLVEFLLFGLPPSVGGIK